MVTTVVNVFVQIDSFIDVPNHDLLPDVIDIGSPVRNTIVKILGIKRPVIRNVVCVAVTDADIINASIEPENCRAN
jgi:hypothetical protein